MIDATAGCASYSAASMDEARRAGGPRRAYGLVVDPAAVRAGRRARRGPARLGLLQRPVSCCPASRFAERAGRRHGDAVRAASRRGRRRAARASPHAAVALRRADHDGRCTPCSIPALSYVPYLVTALAAIVAADLHGTMAVHAFRLGAARRHGGRDGCGGGRPRLGPLAGKACPTRPTSSRSPCSCWPRLSRRSACRSREAAGRRVATVASRARLLAMGFAFAAVAGNLRLGTSLAAFYSVPAFAFAGLTFPPTAMPVPVRPGAACCPSATT